MAENDTLPVVAETHAVAPTNGRPNVAQLLQLAVERLGGEGAMAAVEAVSKLVELQERLDAKDAERAFNKAMIDFKAQCPPIPRNKSTKKVGGDSGTRFAFKYADLETISSIIDPILTNCGLSYTWDTDTATEGKLTGICRISHISGHSVVSKFTAPIDTKAAMNMTQQYGSARTYVCRYALIGALGLTNCEDDTDGMAPQSAETIDENQQATLGALLDEMGYQSPESRDRFLKWLGYENIAEIRRNDYSKAINSLKAKRRAGK